MSIECYARDTGDVYISVVKSIPLKMGVVRLGDREFVNITWTYQGTVE